MQSSVTFVISAAGLGSRLGLNVPKCLLPLLGKPVLQWQLEAVEKLDAEVVVVAGYQARDVIDLVRDLRPNTPVVINHNYRTTGTAASLALGLQICGQTVVSLDGDLLVDPSDLRVFIDDDDDLLGIIADRTKDGVGVEIHGERAVRMGFNVASAFEWSGLLKATKQLLVNIGDGHVFEGLSPLLPIKTRLISAVEIDFPGDIARAEEWLSERVCKESQTWINQ